MTGCTGVEINRNDLFLQKGKELVYSHNSTGILFIIIREEENNKLTSTICSVWEFSGTCEAAVITDRITVVSEQIAEIVYEISAIPLFKQSFIYLPRDG